MALEDFSIFTVCRDDRLCLSPRSTAALISIISLIGCMIDAALDQKPEPVCGVREHLNCLKNILLTLFQMANVLLLLGSMVENPLLLQIYLWYMLGFIVIGFGVAILDFCFRSQEEGAWSLVTFVPEVMLLFVLFRCLSLVDSYKRILEVN